MIKIETKPGIYTTEFLITAVLQIILTLNTLNIWNYLPEKYAWASILAQALLAGLYAVSRGIAKNGKSFDPALANSFTVIPRKKDATRRINSSGY